MPCPFLMSTHILPQKLYHNFLPIVTKIFQFWRPQLGVECVSEIANVFPIFNRSLQCLVSDTIFTPISNTLLSPFQCSFTPDLDTLFIPVSVVNFNWLSHTLFTPFPIPFSPWFPLLSKTLFVPVSYALFRKPCTCVSACSLLQNTKQP